MIVQIPNQPCCLHSIYPMQTVFEPLFAWRWKGIVTRAEFHFCWIDTFSVQLSSPRNWCIRTGETDCRANTFFDCIACQPFHMAVSFIAMCFLLAFLGAPVGPQQWVKKQVNYPTKFAKTCLVVYHHFPPQNISWRRPWAPDVKHDNRSVFFWCHGELLILKILSPYRQ